MFEELVAERTGDLIVADLLLALLTSKLHSLDAAKSYIARTLHLVERLKTQPARRANDPIKVVKVILEVEGDEESLLLPFLANDVKLPEICSRGRACVYDHLDRPHSSVHLCRLEISYFRLRLQPLLLESALSRLVVTTSKKAFVELNTAVLEDCLDYQVVPHSRFDMAFDCLEVAESLTSERNLPLAYLALEQAGLLLGSYDEAAALENRATAIRELFKELSERLTSGDA